MPTLRQIGWNASRVIDDNGGIACRLIYQSANLSTKTYNNLTYDMETNGECSILDCLSELSRAPASAASLVAKLVHRPKPAGAKHQPVPSRAAARCLRSLALCRRPAPPSTAA